MLIGYKLFRKMKNGYTPLFIDRSNRINLGEVQYCKVNIEPVGFLKRPGWHGCYKPLAQHLKLNLANGEQRVWVKIEIIGWVNDFPRPLSQGGNWFTCEAIRIIEELTQDEVKIILNTNKSA